MAELRDAGALGFTDDGKPVVSAGMLRKALQYQRLCGGVIALHEEDPALSGDGVMHEGAVSARLGMAGIPSVSESTMVARDGALALLRGRPRALPASLLRRVGAGAGRRQGGRALRVSGEVSPHHLTLTDDLVRTLDSRFKMNPPLRTEADRRALVEGLRSGVIDCVATDHAPHARHEKEVPFEQAPMGTTGLETAFAALYTELVMPGELELATVVERMTAGGALYGLPTPRIAVGEPANLCLVDLDARFEVGEDGYASRSTNCCFHGRTLHGRVVLTLAAGQSPTGARCWSRAPPRPRPARTRGDRSADDATPPPTSCSRTGPASTASACGADAAAVGEIVFTTSMSGYQEAMTDPSYAGQLITFTYPQIGNYGVSAEAMESDRIHARAAIMRAGVDRDDAPGAEAGWLTWLTDAGIPAITDLDTRALVRHIRDRGRDARRRLPGHDRRARRRGS